MNFPFKRQLNPEAPHSRRPVAADADDPSRRLSIDIDATDPAGVARHIEEVPPADAAAVLQGLSRDFAAQVAEYLDPETAGRILSEMNSTDAAGVIEDMEAPEASMVLEAMDPDDRVDILEPRLRRTARPARSREITPPRTPPRSATSSSYPPDTAGGIMTTQVTSLPEDLSVEQAIVELRRLNEDVRADVLRLRRRSSRRHLVGVLSMRDLILARPETQVNSIMRPNVRSVPATMDQEEVAQIFRKYKYLAMPVVDTRNRLDRADHHRRRGRRHPGRGDRRRPEDVRRRCRGTPAPAPGISAFASASGGWR